VYEDGYTCYSDGILCDVFCKKPEFPEKATPQPPAIIAVVTSSSSQKLTGRRKHVVLTISIGCERAEGAQKPFISNLWINVRPAIRRIHLEAENGFEQWLFIMGIFF
jgi:hypothetical protein